MNEETRTTYRISAETLTELASSLVQIISEDGNQAMTDIAGHFETESTETGARECGAVIIEVCDNDQENDCQ